MVDDEAWAGDALCLLVSSAAMTEEELALNPDLSPLLEAWTAGNDAAFGERLPGGQ